MGRQAVYEGSTVTLAGSGASSYSWDNGVTNGTPFAAPGSTTVYTVTGTDGNNCSNTAQVTLNVTSQINWVNLQWPPTATFSCDGGYVGIYGRVYEPGITNFFWSRIWFNCRVWLQYNRYRSFNMDKLVYCCVQHRYRWNK